MSKRGGQKVRFAMCVSEDTPWFELRRVYRVLPPDRDDPVGWLRVVDEFHEDYLYPAEQFVIIDLPTEAQRLVPDLSFPALKAKRSRLRTRTARDAKPAGRKDAS